MDIVVEHIDSTIINLEIQKLGYDFPNFTLDSPASVNLRA